MVIGDGAKWIKNPAELHFPMAVQIVDLYHAKEHIVKLCKLLFGKDEKQMLRYRLRWWTDLENGAVEKIVREARAMIEDEEGAKEIKTEINYFEENKDRMRYADYRQQDMFVGSGVIEAVCKTIVGMRLKQSAMEWSLGGANSILL